MINQNEIKKMIKEGFSPKLISFELEIPLEQVKAIGSKQTLHSVSKMQRLRDRYYELYSPKKAVESGKRKEISKKTGKILAGEEAIYNPNAPIKAKKKAVIAFVQDLYVILEQTQDLEEVKRLQKRITPEMERIAPMAVGSLKSNFDFRIKLIERKNLSDSIKNNISLNIAQVIAGLANNEIDMQAANAAIDEEARRRVESKPKTRFSLTAEQERKQIEFQIQTVLSENPERYPIKKPETAIAKIQELCGTQKGAALRIVVLNLAGKKHFETARILCNKVVVENKEPELQGSIKRLLIDIRNAEIADFVLKGIRMNASVEEENTYFELLEAGLKKANINPRAISLGKSENGMQNITLADILTGEKQKTGENR